MLDEFSLQLGKGKLVARGTVDGPPNVEATDLTASLDISSLRNFSLLAGRELPDESARLRLHLTGNGEVMELEEFEAVLGESDMRGTFELHTGKIPRVELALTSNRVNLLPYLPTPTPTPSVEPESVDVEKKT